MPAQGRAAALLRDADLVPILVAPDADSVLGAGLLGLALRRAGVPWHARFASSLTKESLAHLPEEAPGQPAVLVGLGAREGAVLDGAGLGPVVVVDARRPRLPEAKEGISLAEGDAPCTAATLAWELAHALDPRAPALLGLAGLDAAGPLDGVDGLRAALLETAEQQGCRPGWVPALPPGPLVERLAGSTRPYLPGFGGRARAAKRLLDALGLDPAASADALDDAQAERLTSALALHLLAKGAPSMACWPLLAPDPRGPWPGGSARELAQLCAAACEAGRPGLALALALGDGLAEAQARPLGEARAQRLLLALVRLEGEPPAGMWPADPDLAADLALAGALALRGGAPTAALAGPGTLHVASPRTPPRALGAAAWEAAQAAGGTATALGPRARLDLPGGAAGEAWTKLQARLEAP